MRRGPDAVRDILNYTELSVERGASLCGLSDDTEKIAFQTAMMMEGCALIEYRILRDASGDVCEVEVATIAREGHEILSSDKLTGNKTR